MDAIFNPQKQKTSLKNPK